MIRCRPISRGRRTILLGPGMAVAFAPLLWLACRGAPEARQVYADAPNTITFAERTARFVRVAIRASSELEPCLDELEVLEARSGRNVALADGGARASASSCLPGYAAHRISHLNDGLYGNAHSWIAATASPGEWAQIELPGPALVSAVVLSRDREGRFRDRVPISVDVLTSMDGQAWAAAAEMRGDLALGPSIAGARSIPVPLQHARYVRLRILGTADGAPAALDEIAVFGRDPNLNLATPAQGAKVLVSSTGVGVSDLLNDGRYGPGSRWRAGRPRDQWVTVRLADRTEVTRIGFQTSDAGADASGRPTVFSADISLDGMRWKTIHREGWGSVPPPPAFGARSAPGPGSSVPKRDSRGYPNLALSDGVKAGASSLIEGFADIHRVEHLNDGLYGNSRSWVAASSPSWVELDLGAPRWVYKLAFASDATGGYRDRAATSFRLLAAGEGGLKPEWRTVLDRSDHAPVSLREEFTFRPVRARHLRLQITATSGGPCRIDEMEVYGSAAPIPAAAIGTIAQAPARAATPYDARVRAAFAAEEYAWLKAYGRADLDPALTQYIRVWDYPEREGEDVLPLPSLPRRPKAIPPPDPGLWQYGSTGTARVADPSEPGVSPFVEHAVTAGVCADTLYLQARASRLLSRHLCVLSSGDWGGCGVVIADGAGLRFDRYRLGAGGTLEVAGSLPIAGYLDFSKAVWSAAVPLSALPRWRTYGIRVGLGLGGRHGSPLGRGVHYVPSDLAVRLDGIARNAFRLRVTNTSARSVAKMRVEWGQAGRLVEIGAGESSPISTPSRSGPIGPESVATFSDAAGNEFVLHLLAYRPLQRATDLLEDLTARLSKKGIDVSAERRMLATCRKILSRAPAADSTEARLTCDARLVKRRLMFRDPDLAGLSRVLCVRRHGFEPSHNYSDLFDATGGPGGSVDVVTIPRVSGRLAPERAGARRLCDAGTGVIRDASASFDARSVYFAWRRRPDDHFHLMRIGADGQGLEQLTSGPYHDVYPTPLPDGGLAFISTRCRARYLCWRPQAYVLFRRARNGSIIPLSYANLSEWAPSVMRDGRLLWTRSEYQDKGADFSHTLWAVRPDGAHAELVFGNTILQPNGYANGRQVPGSSEIICTMISHFGDLNGPLALLRPSASPFDPGGIRSLTPEVPRPGLWPSEECFRDPEPVSGDVFLCSHAPARRFALWIIDRDGNREMLLEDPSFSLMCPTPLRPRRAPTPPARLVSRADDGEFLLSDVYRGLEPAVRRGSVKWLRITQEVRANLERAGAGYRADHPDFQDWYATPTHLVSGPAGWPSFVAKASWGLVPISEDGSARFRAPAGKVLYFSVLDADYNEVQRMRSVVQLAPGEKRGCVGCHEPRGVAPPAGKRPASMRLVRASLSAWDGRPFWFERDVQPVLDRHCVRCHGEGDTEGIVLSGRPDAHLVPASYRTLIERGWVHYFDWGWNSGGNEKAAPLTFGSVRSRLWQVLGDGHHGVRLPRRDQLCLKTWIDLNCPLWGDYQHRPERASAAGLPAR